MLERFPSEGQIKCPHCAELIRRQAILCRYCETGLSKEHFRVCPYCAEWIRKEATLCRFCRTKVSPAVSRALFELEDAYIDKLFREEFKVIDNNPKKISAPASFGLGVRAQVLEVIVRQALAGAPWKELCSVPMQMNNISEGEVEAEIANRKNIAKVKKAMKNRLPKTSVGDLCAITPASLLQTLSLSGSTGILIAERQNKMFKAFLQNGNLVQARLHRLKGLNAIFELITTWNEGYFYFKSDEKSDDFDPDCLLTQPLDNSKPIDRILMECARAEDLSKKITNDLPVGIMSVLERVENFDDLWQAIFNQDLHYIDGLLVGEEDKETISSISLLFTGDHNTVKQIVEMIDYWPTYKTLRAIRLLLEKGLLKSPNTPGLYL